MFSEYNYSGKHMICDFKEIKNIDLLNNSEELKKILKLICKKYCFTILQESCYNFMPIGCTILFLLSESHISIHTFPEKNHIAFDIYTCRQYKDNLVYEEIFKYFISELNASLDSQCRIIDREFI
jgi:S-adenosylmethionine decarboxylase